MSSNAIHKIKEIEQCQSKNCHHSNIIYNVMTLSETMYNFLFCQLSFDLNVKLETIRKLFTDLSTKYLYLSKRSLNSQSQSQNDFQLLSRQKINKQNDKIPLSQFKQQFVETVKAIIMEFNDSANYMTDKYICQVLVDYFQKNDQNLFWERVQKEISYKTKLQLKEYFQKSFLQCQYENISEQDKQKIVELTRAMSQSKPSEIVDVFFNQIGGEVYFRRKVVMFVQYLKRACTK
ncbi:Hypothetical_protein [Hexamita inflata]|uniref:Hypothetical_protein n=1 Tax=Hexamita inflata TaxID=28002 RepID=A0AA86PLA8_9EUKA|nr:Hypothetical protein HINF_LOCUS29524 [Hexamita inflata]